VQPLPPLLKLVHRETLPRPPRVGASQGAPADAGAPQRGAGRHAP